METRTISKTRRVDSVGNGSSCGGDDYCVCFASDDTEQEEDELERRVSHRINFDNHGCERRCRCILKAKLKLLAVCK